MSLNKLRLAVVVSLEFEEDLEEDLDVEGKECRCGRLPRRIGGQRSNWRRTVRLPKKC